VHESLPERTEENRSETLSL